MKTAQLSLGLGLALAACGATAPTFPTGSAASEQAIAAPLPAVGTALRGDPPYDDAGTTESAMPHHHHEGMDHAP